MKFTSCSLRIELHENSKVSQMIARALCSGIIHWFHMTSLPWPTYGTADNICMYYNVSPTRTLMLMEGTIVNVDLVSVISGLSRAKDLSQFTCWDQITPLCATDISFTNGTTPRIRFSKHALLSPCSNLQALLLLINCYSFLTLYRNFVFCRFPTD